MTRLAASGVRVATDEEELADPATRLARLVDPDGEKLDGSAHTACPDHVVIVDHQGIGDLWL